MKATKCCLILREPHNASQVLPNSNLENRNSYVNNQLSNQKINKLLRWYSKTLKAPISIQPKIKERLFNKRNLKQMDINIAK